MEIFAHKTYKGIPFEALDIFSRDATKKKKYLTVVIKTIFRIVKK